jgi:hypothetical protein
MASHSPSRRREACYGRPPSELEPKVNEQLNRAIAEYSCTDLTSVLRGLPIYVLHWRSACVAPLTCLSSGGFDVLLLLCASILF